MSEKMDHSWNELSKAGHLATANEIAIFDSIVRERNKRCLEVYPELFAYFNNLFPKPVQDPKPVQEFADYKLYGYDPDSPTYQDEVDDDVFRGNPLRQKRYHKEFASLIFRYFLIPDIKDISYIRGKSFIDEVIRIGNRNFCHWLDVNNAILRPYDAELSHSMCYGRAKRLIESGELENLIDRIDGRKSTAEKVITERQEQKRRDIVTARAGKLMKKAERDNNVLDAALAILEPLRGKINWTDLSDKVGAWLQDPPVEWMNADETHRAWSKGISRSSVCERLERVKDRLPMEKIGPWKKGSGD